MIIKYTIKLTTKIKEGTKEELFNTFAIFADGTSYEKINEHGIQLAADLGANFECLFFEHIDKLEV